MGPHEAVVANIEEYDNSSQEDSIGHDPQDAAFLLPEAGVVKLNNPQNSRLGWLSVILIIANRMIGTGIFTTTTRVIQHTQSVGITFLFWLSGAIATVAGILVYMEFGLTTPRYYFLAQDRKISVPRNGGELHYLKDILKKPVFFTTCVFGVAFVLLGNVAANSMMVGVRVLQASSGKSVDHRDNFTVRGIAIVVVSFACFFHGFWRRGGIYLMNLFGFIKIVMLLVIIVTGFVSYSGVFGTSQEKATAGSGNFDVHTAFSDPAKDTYGFADSFLAILFAFGGFNQANYVMSEVDNPRKKYKWPAFIAVTGVCILYIFVNIAYFIVVPVDQAQLRQDNFDIARIFFEKTFGTLSDGGNTTAVRVFHGFVAVSSLGNVIVMTYTAARVKQEIAKEGVLPLRNQLSSSWRMPDIPIRKYLGLSSRATDDETPVGALILHWSLSVLLILATAAQKEPMASYRILVSLYSYTIDACFGVCIGAGLLYLRLFANRNWSEKSRAGSGFNPTVSIIAGLLFALVNAFPVIASWIPPSAEFQKSVSHYYPWYSTPTVGWSVLALGVVYYLCFRFLVPHVGHHKGMQLRVQRTLFFHEEHDYPVQWHERIKFDWVIAGSDDDDSAWAGEEFDIKMD